MVSGGICREGLTKLVFHSANVNSFSYKQVLEFYKEDLKAFPGKFFQQDGASSHSSRCCQKEINFLFGENYIPTWEDGLVINGEKNP